MGTSPSPRGQNAWPDRHDIAFPQLRWRAVKIKRISVSNKLWILLLTDGKFLAGLCTYTWKHPRTFVTPNKSQQPIVWVRTFSFLLFRSIKQFFLQSCVLWEHFECKQQIVGLESTNFVGAELNFLPPTVLRWNLITRRPFSRRPTARLPTGLGGVGPKGNKFEQVHGGFPMY